jgi:hypothetical protein
VDCQVKGLHILNFARCCQVYFLKCYSNLCWCNIIQESSFGHSFTVLSITSIPFLNPMYKRWHLFFYYFIGCQRDWAHVYVQWQFVSFHLAIVNWVQLIAQLLICRSSLCIRNFNPLTFIHNTSVFSPFVLSYNLAYDYIEVLSFYVVHLSLILCVIALLF